MKDADMPEEDQLRWETEMDKDRIKRADAAMRFLRASVEELRDSAEDDMVRQYLQMNHQHLWDTNIEFLKFCAFISTCKLPKVS